MDTTPRLSEGSLKPPVFLTSTFVFKTAQDGKDFFDFTSGRRAPDRGQAGGPGLFALQQSQPRGARGSARAVGAGRDGGGVLERHVRDFDGPVGARAAGRCDLDEPALVRRDGDLDRQDAARLRRERGELHCGTRSRGRYRGGGARAGARRGKRRPHLPHHDGDSRQSDQQPGRSRPHARDLRENRQGAGRARVRR